MERSTRSTVSSINSIGCRFCPEMGRPTGMDDNSAHTIQLGQVHTFYSSALRMEAGGTVACSMPCCCMCAAKAIDVNFPPLSERMHLTFGAQLTLYSCNIVDNIGESIRFLLEKE